LHYIQFQCVNASFCGTYDTDKMCVFTSCHKNEQLVFRAMNLHTILCEIGKNASDKCVVLSEAYGGEAMKKSSDLEWHKPFKEFEECGR